MNDELNLGYKIDSTINLFDKYQSNLKEQLYETFLNNTFPVHKKIFIAIKFIKDILEKEPFNFSLEEDFNNLKEYLILVLKNIEESDKYTNLINRIQNTKESLSFLVDTLETLSKKESEKFNKLSFKNIILSNNDCKPESEKTFWITLKKDGREVVLNDVHLIHTFYDISPLYHIMQYLYENSGKEISIKEIYEYLEEIKINNNIQNTNFSDLKRSLGFERELADLFFILIQKDSFIFFKEIFKSDLKKREIEIDLPRTLSESKKKKIQIKK